MGREQGRRGRRVRVCGSLSARAWAGVGVGVGMGGRGRGHGRGRGRGRGAPLTSFLPCQRTSWPLGRTMPFWTSASWKRPRSSAFSACSAARRLDCCEDRKRRSWCAWLSFAWLASASTLAACAASASAISSAVRGTWTSVCVCVVGVRARAVGGRSERARRVWGATRVSERERQTDREAAARATKGWARAGRWAASEQRERRGGMARTHVEFVVLADEAAVLLADGEEVLLRHRQLVRPLVAQRLQLRLPRVRAGEVGDEPLDERRRLEAEWLVVAELGELRLERGEPRRRRRRRRCHQPPPFRRRRCCCCSSRARHLGTPSRRQATVGDGGRIICCVVSWAREFGVGLCVAGRPRGGGRHTRVGGWVGGAVGGEALSPRAQ